MRPPEVPRAPGSPSSTARYAVVLIVGVVAGAFTLLIGLRMLEHRTTWQDRHPRALMQLHQSHVERLADALAQARCDVDTVRTHLASLRVLSDDLEAAFPAWRDHRGFVGHADALRRTLDASLNGPADCATLAAGLDAVRADCQACHRDTRY